MQGRENTSQNGARSSGGTAAQNSGTEGFKILWKNSKQQVSYKMAVDFSWKLQSKASTVLRKTTWILELSTQTRRPAGTQNGHPPCLLSESHRAGPRGGPRGEGQVVRTRPTLATGRDMRFSRGQNKWRPRESTKPTPTQRVPGTWTLSAGSWCVWDSEHGAERGRVWRMQGQAGSSALG